MKNIKRFKKYVNNYKLYDKQIFLKYNHSIRTAFICEKIAKMMNLSKEDIKLIKLIGLLHDIGRFHQLEEYNNYSDTNIDHGDYGVEVLFEKGLIKDFTVLERDYKIVKLAIKNHNKYKIEDNLSERELMFCKLIRDCDKIEILYRISIEDIDLNEDDSAICEGVREQFNSKESICTQKRITKNDKIISFLSFVYDINYIETFKYLKQKKIIEQIYKLIKDKDKFKYYFDTVISFIDQKIKEDIC